MVNGLRRALYLTLHERAREVGPAGLAGQGAPSRRPQDRPSARQPGMGTQPGGEAGAPRGGLRGRGQASVAVQRLGGPGRLECHTLHGAQAAINLKSLGILLAFSQVLLK